MGGIPDGIVDLVLQAEAFDDRRVGIGEEGKGDLPAVREALEGSVKTRKGRRCLAARAALGSQPPFEGRLQRGAEEKTSRPRPSR
jgi:hypothetical protein